jgi:Xaa-Pro aminopeptidase
MQRLTAEGCQTRRERLLEKLNVEQVVICNPRHIQYLCGLYVSPLLLANWGYNFLFIDGKTGYTKLLIHSGAAGEAQFAHVDEIVTWTNYGMTVDKRYDAYTDILGEVQKHLDRGRIGLEVGWFPYGLQLNDVVDVNALIVEMRRFKYDDELACIQAAIDAITAGHQAAREVIRAGMTELDLYSEVYAAIVKAAGHAVVPLSDFVSGGQQVKRTSGLPTERILQSGDLIILDIYPLVNGYKGDFTATLAVADTLTDEQIRLETAVHNALAAAEAILKPGTIGGDVFRAVGDSFAQDGYPVFDHHAGHGLGLGHPEAPYFIPLNTEMIQVGDVVTLEPGMYLEKFGARIEHNYRITESGYEHLTHHDTKFLA